jgi:hypothetical protein
VSVRWSRPSRPGEFHPEPLTEPNVSLSTSCHRAKAAAFRCASGSSRRAGWPMLNGGDPPPSLHEHYTRFITTTGRSAPARRIATFGLTVGAACAFFACHRRTGSQVPYESPNESHAPSTPDTAWPVGRWPPRSSRNIGKAPVLMSSKQISMLERRFTCVRLSHPYLTRSSPRLFHDVHRRGFWPKQLMGVWSLLLQSGSEGSSSISRTAQRRRTGVFMTQCHFLP